MIGRITNRVRQMVATRYRIGAGLSRAGALQRDIDALARHLNDNRNIQALSETRGWQEIEATIAPKALEKLKGLPRKLLAARNRADLDECRNDAQFITDMNWVLGLVNETLLESQRTMNLINNKLAIQARLQEEEEANA